MVIQSRGAAGHSSLSHINIKYDKTASVSPTGLLMPSFRDRQNVLSHHAFASAHHNHRELMALIHSHQVVQMHVMWSQGIILTHFMPVTFMVIELN